jgi:hypothetical protein
LNDEIFSPHAALAEICVHGLTDWSYVTYFIAVAREIEDDQQKLRLVIDGLISRAIADGLLLPGDVTDDFHPWTGNPGEWIIRLLDALRSSDLATVYPGDIAWFRNTAKGDELATSWLNR